MKCGQCNGDVEKKKENLPFKSKTLGEIQIPDIDFEECRACGDILISPESSKKISRYIRQKEQNTLNMTPIGYFVTATEAAAILGISKQAFSKNLKIKRGLIFTVAKGKSKLFLKESVELFKEKQNGKFLLKRKGPSEQKTITISSQELYIGSPIRTASKAPSSYAHFTPPLIQGIDRTSTLN